MDDCAPQQNFHVDEICNNGSLTLAVAGELDLCSAPVLKLRLRELRDEGRPVRLDLSRLEFIDSTGLHVLIDAWQSAREAGSRLEVDRNLSAQVSRVLSLVRMDHVLLGEAGSG